MTNHPLAGFNYFLSGLRLITQPGLRRFVIFPALINILLFIGFFFLLRHYLNEFNLWFASFLPYWLQWLSALLWVLFLISFIFIFIYAFVTLANIIGAPFNNLLAQQVEKYLTHSLPPESTLLETMRDVPRVMGRQLAILGYYLPRVLLLIVLFFIPVLQILAPLAWFLFNAWFLALTYIDYPSDNHRVSLKEARHWLSARRFTALGFGIGVMVMTMIPFLNFLSIPAAVAGATKFWLEDK